jgi:DNA-binding transcriptional ArsR family regulator
MHSEQLSLIFAALSDATRRAILEQIGPEEVAVRDLTAKFTISQPAVSKHLAVLERAGLVMRRRNGRNNLCRVNQVPLATAARFLAKYKLFWRQRLQALEKHLQEENDDHHQN